MRLRGLILASVILAVLAGALYWSNHRKTKEDTAAASISTSPKILSLKQDDIAQVDIKKKGQDDVRLAKNDSGKWQVTLPKPFGADQDTVSSMLSTLSSLSSDRLVEDKATDLNPYGLASPALEVDLAEKGNKTQKLLIGDDTPTGSAVYAALAGDPRVFTIASYNKTSMDKGLNELRDKRLLIFNSDKVSRVELVAKGQDLEFGRSKDEWQILKPRPVRADGPKIDALVRDLNDAQMDLSGNGADEKKSASAFGSGTPVATAKVTTESGTQELQVRKNKDEVYAKSSVVPGIYKVSSGLGRELDKSLDDFWNKKLFDFGFDDPDKIDMRDGANSYALSKTGEDRWWNGKKTDVASVQPFIDKVRDLSASKIAASGFGKPVIEITVTSNDGKRVEKVLIAKDAARYIAKRENEPALYELDSKAVQELQKSASDVKPAPPPAK